MFQYLMGLYEVAGFMGELISGISTTPWVVFLLINVILFVLGTFMDMAATILIATPIFLPIAMKYGMDPVQFGMVIADQLRARAEHTRRWARHSSWAVRSARSRSVRS